MDIKIIPSKLSGTIEAIASKSYAHRILIAAALSNRTTRVHMSGLSDDIAATIGALRAMGAETCVNEQEITVFPIAPKAKPLIFCKESGTTARLLLPVAAALYNEATITGEGSLLARPFDSLCEAMEANGCRFDSKKLPITFSGQLSAGQYSISGQESSQFVSGLLFALPLMEGKSSINLLSPLQSKGYVDMTIHILRLFGIAGEYEIEGRQSYISPGRITVEGDWSNAAFWLACGVQVSGLSLDSLQKDKSFIYLKEQDVIDIADVPDLAPILAVCSSVKKGRTAIINAARLRLKESDRLQSVLKMICDLGGDASLDGDGMIIWGKSKLRGGCVDSCNDHRLVMAAAIASCFCQEPVIIRNAQAVNKSYPDFFKHFNQLGGRASVI